MDEAYFNWLYEKIRPEDNTDLVPFLTVSAMAHRMQFNDAVPNDQNRSADAIELRREYEIEYPGPSDRIWMAMPASIFEVLIALTRRCNFWSEQGVAEWYDIFMQNLGLTKFNDVLWIGKNTPQVKRRLEKFNARIYGTNGVGGLFPLRDAHEDQREIELWFQMASYMTENQLY